MGPPRRCTRSRSRSRQRHASPPRQQQPRAVTWIATSDDSCSMVLVNADLVDNHLLHRAKGLANFKLEIKSVGDEMQDFPHDLGGGWPDVHPEEQLVSYAQVSRGYKYEGHAGAATGSNKKVRDQGVALALLLSVAFDFADLLEEDDLDEHLRALLAESAVAAQQLLESRDRRKAAADEQGVQGGSSRSGRRKAAADDQGVQGGSSSSGRRKAAADDQGVQGGKGGSSSGSGGKGSAEARIARLENLVGEALERILVLEGRTPMPLQP